MLQILSLSIMWSVPLRLGLPKEAGNSEKDILSDLSSDDGIEWVRIGPGDHS